MDKNDVTRDHLIQLLREHSLVLGDVTLSSGATASYYVDVRRTIMQPAGLTAAGKLIAIHATALDCSAVGGPVMAAIPLACAAISVPAISAASAAGPSKLSSPLSGACARAGGNGERSGGRPSST